MSPFWGYLIQIVVGTAIRAGVPYLVKYLPRVPEFALDIADKLIDSMREHPKEAHPELKQRAIGDLKVAILERRNASRSC